VSKGWWTPNPLPGFYNQVASEKRTAHGRVGRFCATLGLSVLGHVHHLASCGEVEDVLANDRAHICVHIHVYTLQLGVFY